MLLCHISRFIPTRSTTDFESGHHALCCEDTENLEDPLSPGKLGYQKVLNEAISNSKESKILSYKSAAPTAREGEKYFR